MHIYKLNDASLGRDERFSSEGPMSGRSSLETSKYLLYFLGSFNSASHRMQHSTF